ncbi:MAG: hypothetical protein Q9211_001115 [Gyalolechia sp. 1 TL-2023]
MSENSSPLVIICPLRSIRPARHVESWDVDKDDRRRYNPELQKKSLENRKGKQQDFDNFVNKLKEYSKSDKPIWEAAAADEAQTRANSLEDQRRQEAEIRKRRDEIKRLSITGN